MYILETLTFTVFVDAPIVLQPVDITSLAAQYAAQRPALDEIRGNEPPVTTEDSTARAWWRANEDRTVYQGIEDSILTIRDVLKQRRFDVCSLYLLRRLN